MNFARRTYLYLCISLLILLAGFTILILNAFRLTELRRNINDNQELLNRVHTLNADLLQAESAMRGFYLVNNTWYLNNYNTAVEGFRKTMGELEKDQSVKARYGLLLRSMEQTAQSRVNRLNKGMEIFRSKGMTGGLEFVHDGQGKVLMDRFRLQSRHIESSLRDDRLKMQHRMERMAVNNRISMVVIGIIAACTLVVLSIYFIRTQKKIASINDRLLATNHELDEYARITSHDLQEPLRMTRSFLMMLEKKYAPQLDDQAREYIFRAAHGAERMQNLVVSLLAYAKAGKAAGEFGPADMNEILDEVKHDLQPLISENNATLTSEKLPVVTGDKTQLFRLLLNLVGNAIKFRKKEEAPVVRIEAETAPDGVRIRIADNGIGIPQAYMHKLFKPFVRLHNNSEYQGTGLGLATCKKIVEMHGGILTISSRENEGSVFTIFLPHQS